MSEVTGKPEQTREHLEGRLEDSLPILQYHTLLCDNLLRLLEREMHNEGVRRKVLAHGLRHLRRIGVTFTENLFPKGER